ncbi:MAG TPA: autotransporter-associated beta strand repeat-containing protein [Candidatus Paceibacterota bacterium]|nr:autotransporter-associated beta strand repeat-containing protein [Candidatus Paceibacterota bacterium]
MHNPNYAITAALSRRSPILALLTLLLAFGPAAGLWAADVAWTNAANATWSTANNWDPNTVPTNTDNAILGAVNSANAYVTLTDTRDIGVGRLTLHPDRTLGNVVLRQTDGGVARLCVYGLDGILLTNASTVKRIQIAQSDVKAPIPYLAGDGAIGVAGAMEVLFYTEIKEMNGSHGFTKTGPGTLTLQGTRASTYTGPTTISEGKLNLKAAAANLGSGTLYMNGGNLLCGADRSTVAPLANSVVVTADSTITADSTLTASRYILFSGPFSGSAGTLAIDNQGVTGNMFVVRLSGGGFDFTRPIMLNLPTSKDGALALLQLQNTAAAGAQTFSGEISSYDATGMVERSGADGTTIFTGANTYQGGTVISQGTLLANNTTGSALGSGTVTVTNVGILGGNGIVDAGVTVTRGGTISPGAAAASIGNLTISYPTWDQGAVYHWEIASATGSAGTAWDLITVQYASDTASTLNPVTIKVDSRGVTPTGWNPAVARDWIIVQSSLNAGFNPGNFAIDTTAFSGVVAGIFGLYADSNGSIHLTYTPAEDIVINVASGTKTQTEAGYAQLTGDQGLAKTGNGELVLDNPSNDYAGSTKVLAGTLSINQDAANGSGTLGSGSSATYLGDTSGTSNAMFNINVNGISMYRDIVVRAGSTGTKTIGTTLASATVNYLGDITFQDSATLSSPAGSSVLFGGDLSGDGGVTLNGPGALTLGGIGTYAGPTAVNTPTLNLTGPAFGTNEVTYATATTLDNTSGADVVLHNSPQNWNSDLEFVGSAGLYLGSGPVTLGGDRKVTVDAATLVVSGPIGGNGGLTKLGDGALALRGPASSYTGGTTNLAGWLVLNGTATLGDGTGTFVLGGGNVLCTESHAASPLANPVLMTADTVLACTNRYSGAILAFSGPFTVPGGHKLTIANKGWDTTISGVRLQGPGNIDWPIVVGDPAHDRPAGGVTNQIQFYSTTNTPPQIVSGVISGPGELVRGNVIATSGGATIFTAQNTFTGTAYLFGGAIGFGADSVSSVGVITSGPIGTSLFTIGNQSAPETNMTVFAYGAPRVIENPIFLNGARNVVIDGTNDLTFTGPIAAGGIGKMWTVRGPGRGILTGQISTSGGEGAPLTKAGGGTLVLTADNAYTGATTVQQGTLLANNTAGSATGSGAVYVRSSGTLGGTGTVAGRVTATGGSVAPGNNGADTLTAAGGVTLSSTGTYVWDLAANSTSNPGTDFDVLAVTGGTVVLGGTAQLAINFIGSATVPNASEPFWQAPHEWTILTVGGTASNPGPTVFSTIINGTNSAGTFSTAADGSGNIILKFTPGMPPPPQPVISGTIEGVGTPNPTLSWSTEVGYPYRLQYKTNLNQPEWLVVGDVTATGTTASMTHTNALWPQCFYRVIVP